MSQTCKNPVCAVSPMFCARLCRFQCDHCAHLASDNAPGRCFFCRQSGGALRQTNHGNWAHVGCVLYDPFLNYNELSGNRCSQPIRLCTQGVSCGICARGEVVTPPHVPQPRCALNCASPASGRRVVCPSCRRSAAHVACAQVLGSGWHILVKDSAFDGTATVEILCPSCHDVRLDATSTVARPQYRYIDPRPLEKKHPMTTHADMQNALYTFQDWCCGASGGFRRVGERTGGLCTGACDISEEARMAYMQVVGDWGEGR